MCRTIWWDILPPEASFNVVDFKERAERLIDEITARGKLPHYSWRLRGFILRRCLKTTSSAPKVKIPHCARSLKRFLAEQGKEALLCKA